MPVQIIQAPILNTEALKTLLIQDRKVAGVLEDVVGDAARRRRHRKGIYTNPRKAVPKRKGNCKRNAVDLQEAPHKILGP